VFCGLSAIASTLKIAKTNANRMHRRSGFTIPPLPLLCHCLMLHHILIFLSCFQKFTKMD
ncbi:MAG: hypothetical protein QXP46_07925, partial [Archaeoglobaceae archaeon]